LPTAAPLAPSAATLCDVADDAAVAAFLVTDLVGPAVEEDLGKGDKAEDVGEVAGDAE
jgi:hypothetical protein